MRFEPAGVLLLALGSWGGQLLAQPGSSDLTSDFVPPHGALPNGKWQARLLTATSTDGLTFTRSNTVLSDQARSPNLVVSGGALYLYFNTPLNGESGDDFLAVAVSSDQGKTWTFKRVQVVDRERPLRPLVADVRVMENGGFRMSFTGHEDKSFFLADSTDGIHFAKIANAYSERRKPVDFNLGGGYSLTVPIAGAWHVYLGESGPVRHGVSQDGVSFAFAPRAPAAGALPGQYSLNSAVALGDGRNRFYVSSGGLSCCIRSFVTRDGYNFDPEPGMRLALDSAGGLERAFLRDAAVAVLPDGTYFMTYTTAIP